MEKTVQFMLNNGARMEKLNQGRSGHSEKNINTLNIIAACVASYIRVSTFERFDVYLS